MSTYDVIAPHLTAILSDQQIDALTTRRTSSVSVTVPIRGVTPDVMELACKFARYMNVTEIPLEDIQYLNYGPIDIVFRINSKFGYDTGLTQDDIVIIKRELDDVIALKNGQ